MKSYLKKLLEKERFNPGFISFFINPFFIIRLGLYKGIRKSSKLLCGHMLDFGCGSKPYRQLFNVDQYVGLDLKESGNNKQHKSVDVYYDGKTIPFEDKSFDSVFTSEVFEHVFNLDEVLIEINRVLKTQGKILITVPFVWDEHEVPYDFGRYSSYGIKFMLEKHGFKVISLDKSSNFVLTIFQLWNSYMFQQLSRWKPMLILLPLMLPLVHSIAYFMSFLLPDNKDLYLNNVVVAQKIKSSNLDQ